jgi:hypothetical protein
MVGLSDPYVCGILATPMPANFLVSVAYPVELVVQTPSVGAGLVLAVLEHLDLPFLPQCLAML